MTDEFPHAAQRLAGGWLSSDPEEIPEAWRARVVPLFFVPLMPGEVNQVLRHGNSFSQIPDEDLTILRFLAAGAPVTQVAREMRLPLRTVQRRVARYRDRLGASTTTELAALLARRGF